MNQARLQDGCFHIQPIPPGSVSEYFPVQNPDSWTSSGAVACVVNLCIDTIRLVPCIDLQSRILDTLSNVGVGVWNQTAAAKPPDHQAPGHHGVSLVCSRMEQLLRRS